MPSGIKDFASICWSQHDCQVSQPPCWQAVAATPRRSDLTIWLSCAGTGPRDRDGRERSDRAFEPLATEPLATHTIRRLSRFY